MKPMLRSVAILLLSLIARTAMAGVLSPGGTLADYIVPGFAGTIDDKVFSDFAYDGTASPQVPPIPASAILVTPVNTPFNPGLQFSAPWTVGSGGDLDSLISYTVSVSPGGTPITDISATMTGFSVILGSVMVTETTIEGMISLSDNAEGVVPSAETTFAPTMGPIMVTVDISLTGRQGATLSTVTNRFSELLAQPAIPEPSTLIIWSGLGAMGLIAAWRRRKHQAV